MPKKSEDNLTAVSVRVRQSTKADLELLATKSGMNLAEYVRALMLHAAETRPIFELVARKIAEKDVAVAPKPALKSQSSSSKGKKPYSGDRPGSRNYDHSTPIATAAEDVPHYSSRPKPTESDVSSST